MVSINDELAGPLGDDRREGPVGLVGRAPFGAVRCSWGAVEDVVDQPVEGPFRGQDDRAEAVGGVEPVLHAAAEPVADSARGVVDLGLVLLADGLDDPAVGAGQRVAGAGFAFVDQAPQAVAAPGIEQLVETAGGDAQLGGLRFHAGVQRQVRGVLGAGFPVGGGVAVAAAEPGGDLVQVGLHLGHARAFGGGQAVQDRGVVEHGAGGLVRRDRLGLEGRVGHQRGHGDDLRDAAFRAQVHDGLAQPGDLVAFVLELDPVVDRQFQFPRGVHRDGTSAGVRSG